MGLIKTPIRYPGGKSRMTKFLDKFVPDEHLWTEYREPFLGGASMLLWMRQKYPDRHCWVNDKYYNLYCFWVSMRDHSDVLQAKISHLKNQYPDKESGRELFAICNDVLRQSDIYDPVDLATCFYIVNKTSFSGLTQDSRYAPMAYDQNFGWGVIQKFPLVSALLQGVKITHLDYTELLSDSEGTFIYLDPPYDIKYSLYGGNNGHLHRGFDHISLSALLHSARSRWMLSYNDNPAIRELYAGFAIDDSFGGKYTMNCPRTEEGRKKKSKGNSELVIKNY
jgi:site-specific DNA-adenine methylase